MATITLNRGRRIAAADRQKKAEYMPIRPAETILNRMEFDGKVFRPSRRRFAAVHSKRRRSYT